MNIHQPCSEYAVLCHQESETQTGEAECCGVPQTRPVWGFPTTENFSSLVKLPSCVDELEVELEGLPLRCPFMRENEL